MLVGIVEGKHWIGFSDLRPRKDVERGAKSILVGGLSMEELLEVSGRLHLLVSDSTHLIIIVLWMSETHVVLDGRGVERSILSRVFVFVEPDNGGVVCCELVSILHLNGIDLEGDPKLGNVIELSLVKMV